MNERTAEKREARCHLWLNELEDLEVSVKLMQQRPPSKTSKTPLFTLPVSCPVAAAMTDQRFYG